MPDSVVLSYGDALIRESDLRILEGPYWLNDQIIGFCFEYLHRDCFGASPKLCFVSPEVSQFVKLSTPEDIPMFFEPLEMDEKELVVFPVNNANDPNQPGGTHWSLLFYTSQGKEFFHLDSASGMNGDDAAAIARHLHRFLQKKKLQEFPFRFTEVPVRKQNNGYDCGIHVVCNAEHASRHLLLYGKPDGLELLTEDVIKNRRKQLKELILTCAQQSKGSSTVAKNS